MAKGRQVLGGDVWHAQMSLDFPWILNMQIDITIKDKQIYNI